MFANSPCSNIPSHSPFGGNTRKALGPLERNDEHTERQTHSKRDRSMVDATDHAVEVYPPDIVRRRALAWDGMAAEIVQATRREAKAHFRASRSCVSRRVAGTASSYARLIPVF